MFSQAYFIQADMFSLPFKNNSFDVVFCLNTLHHFHKILFEKIIQELARITKNLLVIEIRNQIYLGNVIYAKFIIPHTYKNLPSYSYDSSYVNTLLDDEGFKMLSSRGKRAVDIMNRRLVLAYKKNS